MSATITLPSLLRTRLAAIERRIRLLRAVRGFAWLVLVLALSAAAAVFADYWLDLPALARQIVFVVWLAEGVGLLLLGLVVPLSRRIEAAALAAVIEEKYPDLGERLTSAVELADASDEGHGSPLLIALLVEETAERSAPLDFRPAVSACRAGILASLAAAVALLIAAPAFVRPRQYGDLTQRFFRPWDIAPVAAPYDIAVSPGDAIAARGRCLTLSAHLTPRNEKIVLPDAATLLVVEADGKETRQAMPRTDNGDYTLAYKVSGDVSYRIEAGEVVSDSYRLTAIAPVELAAESPRITIAPPAYARSVKEEETVHGLVDLSPLQHSEIRFDFRFTRPAVAGYLELGDNSVRHPLTLSADRQEATLTIPAKKEGQYRLVLEAEHGIRTELPGGTIRVQPDQPPSVLRFAGKEELRSVLPYERIPLEIEAADDIGVAGVELEYRINDGEAVRQPLDLQGGSATSVVARHVLELAGKVKEDDRFSYRFHVRDNLPKQYEGPHVIVYPADRWRTLRIARRGDPFQQRDILAQRDDINRRLQAIREALIQEGRGVFKVRQETRLRPSLSPDKLKRVKQLQDENRTSRKALEDVAQIAEATPALQSIAERARDVAEREMAKSQQALKVAESLRDSERTRGASAPHGLAERNHQFETADEQLDSAVKRLDELQKTNNRLAQERLDRAKLETLADREKRLAEQAAELAAKHPVLDPKARELAEKIKREQAEVAQELERLAQQSEPLKRGLEQARQEQAKQMAERARALAQAQRDLARAESETERQSQADRLAELVRRQQELAERQAKLARETRSSAPVAQTVPLKPEDSQRAAEALKQGNTPEAVRRQEQAANELERLVQAFERAVKVSADPKEAARQLEQAEKALRQRVQEETARKDEKQPLSERLRPLEAEQKAIRRAAEQLSVPPKHAEASKVKEQIGERAARAAEALQKQDAPQAQARMDETRHLLHRLADLLPNLDQRRQHAYREMERLRRHQEEIARQVEQFKKNDPSTAQRLAEAARRQAESAEALSKMDAPNQEERRERTTDALNRALADLLDGRREDVPASQQEAKRQLERLDQALRGQKPADERARELARKQRKLAEDAARAASEPKTTPQQKQELQRQQQLAEQTRNLPASEAPQRQREASDAVQRAAQAAQTQPASDEIRKRMEEAAGKLDELARQMAGAESDAARAERLARRQSDAATEAVRQRGKAATLEAQRHQQEIAREAREVRGGDEAQREKQRAMEALRQAQQAPAKEQASAQRRAADALRDLADRLAGREDAAAKANEIARRQRALADETAKAETSKASPEESKRAADRQTELARQLRRLNGKDALPQVVETRLRMADAAVALERAKSPAEAKRAVARAAESAEKLAEQLGKATAARKPVESSGRTTSAKPAAQSPRQLAKQMAQQQRQLAQATQKAANAASGQNGKDGRPKPLSGGRQPPEKRSTQGADAPRSEGLSAHPKSGMGKAMEDLARQQRELNQQASRLPANEAQRGLEQARAVMNKAEQALARKDAIRAARKQSEAADALERLAQQLPAQTPALTRRSLQETAANAAPHSLPSKEQSEQARQLARQQRELRDAVQRAARTARGERPVVRDNPVEELAQKQAELAQQAADLAQNIGREQGENAPAARQAEQARQKARQAAQHMQAGALPQARQAGQQTAERLRQLAAWLARTPRGDDEQAADPLQKTRQLEQRQEEINRRLQPLADDTRAQAAQQQNQQRHLQQETGEMMRQFQRLKMQRAKDASQQAQQAMQQAREQAQRGDSAAEKQSQERAAQGLDRAAQAASEPRPLGSGGKPPLPNGRGSEKAGEAVAQAGKQMAAAQGQLQQGQPARAQSAMKQAAQSLTQAAQQMSPNSASPQRQQGMSHQPIGLGRLPGGLPDLSAYGLDKTTHAGKSWGELPGELRTKIVQDMKTRYGDDYARMIKYYFEHIADTKKK